MSAPEVLLGWKAIAAVLGVTTRGAQKRALRDVDPLPVRLGHKGPFAYLSAVRDWIHRQDVAYQVAARMRAEARAAVEHGRACPRGRKCCRSDAA